ncbi:MAG: UDP-N-acetylmuramoyl-L-alanyl-D-glutamate--2,6-diaminopimelate ligase [Chloroflexi bacterium]|nr:UDP-N-acetylmuramoyl-L-alanyl-D-glutamate--2,6-diaminopimelate ligase [Chloroflexota bacterium]
MSRSLSRVPVHGIMARMTAIHPPRAQTLGQLAQALGLSCSQPDLLIRHITADSRQVRPGALFVAYVGVRVDGHRFIEQALRRGAVAVVGEKALQLPTPYLRVRDARRALGLLAAAWEGFPTRRMGVIGVTGTDGKTSTSAFIHSILTAAGRNAGLLTTVHARIGERIVETGLHTTTPDALTLQAALREMVDAGGQWAVVETTSHGLSQWRVAGVDYDLAVVTNVTHEHLDEHGDYAGYLAAKARLLDMTRANRFKSHLPKMAILNADDISFEPMLAHAPRQMLSYGVRGGDVRAEKIELGAQSVRFVARGLGRRVEVEARMPGRFTVYNALAAIAVAFALNIDDAAIQQGVFAMKGIPGRMERIERGQDFVAIVDFAHTPFALDAALRAARDLTSGRVIAVFGSAGLRDVDKREMMGEVAGRLADLAIITAEDPRTEDLQAIMAAIARACQRVGGQVLLEPDRYRAMRLALTHARPGDVVMVCGKGHEQSMCFGEIEHPWDDRVALAHALDAHLGRTTSPPPFVLPTYEKTRV